MTDILAGPIFWVAVAACAVAQVALLHAFFLGAARPAATATRRFWATETLWTVLPAVALAVLLGASWQAMHPDRRPAWRSAAVAPATPATVPVAPLAGAGR